MVAKIDLRLTQFNVISHSFITQNDSSRVSVEIVLQRIFSYHLTNTFIPTSSLLLLVEVTLYFNKSQTELAISLTLTIMLDMYTLYQSITEPLTKTAYLKMIDYWLLFCLLTPFAIFMIEINWLLQKTKRFRCLFPFRFQFLVPLLSSIFILCYFITASVIY